MRPPTGKLGAVLLELRRHSFRLSIQPLMHPHFLYHPSTRENTQQYQICMLRTSFVQGNKSNPRSSITLN